MKGLTLIKGDGERKEDDLPVIIWFDAPESPEEAQSRIREEIERRRFLSNIFLSK